MMVRHASAQWSETGFYYTWFSRLLLSKLFLILVFSCPCHSPDFEEKQGPKKN